MADVMLEETCPKCGLQLKEVTFKSGKKAKKCTGANYNAAEKREDGCDYIQWLPDTAGGATGGSSFSKPAPEVVADRVCPLCGSALHKMTTKNGKKMIKCSTQTWSPSTGTQGCPHIEWVNE